MYLLLQNLEQKSTKHTRAVIMHFCPSVAQQRRSEPAVAAAAAQAQEAQTFETPIVCRLSGEKKHTRRKRSTMATMEKASWRSGKTAIIIMYNYIII
jgi:hypothetical protein